MTSVVSAENLGTFSDYHYIVREVVNTKHELCTARPPYNASGELNPAEPDGVFSLYASVIDHRDSRKGSLYIITSDQLNLF